MEENQSFYRLLDSCKKGNGTAQEELYKSFYNYVMGIALRYSRDREEAIEIVNDGFFKVFTNLDKFTKGLSFKGWLRRIVINAAIDYYRRNEKHYHGVDISYAKQEYIPEDVLDEISEKEIITLIQELPASYRIVFNLYVIEGYKHEEIAQKLNISVGTSKSNLSVARTKLQLAINKMREIKGKKHG
ncbi:RNA polymerase ECF-type sigma factor [Fulvivirga imtechensis AK7]|uniref:RNA polymerase ECF-type sigma factor n=1 Tax=Fulvivirga imtechensis AK7 TaxID=1237149 RepID=L8K0L8_9BACT|nr:sigma-70 family RNA polymerase sigma factor [Fulvivirga imtechensis]ELR73022.1 RNA polymerase ECF-type sigma factor [Fulvivirga imtechensis AK7]